MRVNPFFKRPTERSAPASPQGATYVDRDGFSVLTAHFELPTDSMYLALESKRALTICNLFINHHLSVSEIAQLLEHDLAQVVQVLVQKKIVRDRRGKPSIWPDDVERRRPQETQNPSAA